MTNLKTDSTSSHVSLFILWEVPRVTTTLSTLTMRRRILLQLRQHLIEITLRVATYEFRQIQGKKKGHSHFCMGHQCRGRCPKLHLYVTESVRLESCRYVHHSLKTTELTCEWPSPRSMVLTSGDRRCNRSHDTLKSEEECVILLEI